VAVQDRLQPSLLDRLMDDEPQSQQESREKRVMSLKRLREAVLRDLAWLMNTSDLTSTEDLRDYPLVGQSVLNYGLPVLAGHTVSNVDLPAIERLLKQAILNFEPRILKNTLKVRVAVADDQMNHNAMSFLIEGELWAQPVPQRLFLKTEIDLETGSVTVTDQGGQGPV
jgi:type VI secretion system protein ImpF